MWKLTNYTLNHMKPLNFAQVGLYLLFKSFIYLGNLYPQCGAQSHDPEITGCMFY